MAVSQDTDGAVSVKMPIYASGVTLQGPWKFGPGEVNVPVSCGGQVVFPGDILVGDRDGVVVIHVQDAVEVAKAARAHLEKESRTIAKIADNFDAYIESHLATTAKRMDGKGIETIEDSYANVYGLSF